MKPLKMRRMLWITSAAISLGAAYIVATPAGAAAPFMQCITNVKDLSLDLEGPCPAGSPSIVGYSQAGAALAVTSSGTVYTNGCPWPDFSPRFWPREVPTPQSGCSGFGQRRSVSFLTRFLHAE